MNTPITDLYTREAGTVPPQTDVIPSELARRLELDRATFRQALIDIYLAPAADSRALANAALQAASKFEGEEHAP